MSDYGIRLVADDLAEDARLVDLERADRLAEFSPTRAQAAAPRPLLGGGLRAHLLTDQEVRVIAGALATRATALADVGDQALTLGGLRRQLLDGIGETP